MSRSFLVVLCASLFAVGCGGEKLAQVDGTVTFDGRPIEDGTIIFEAPGVRPATGKITGGKIVEITTYEPGDGVAVGKHQIAVQAVVSAAPAAPAPEGGDPGTGTSASLDSMKTTSLLPAKYADPSTSGLSAEIKPGVNTLKLELKTETP